MYHVFIIRSTIDRHLGCFQRMAIMHRAAMNMDVQVSLWDYLESFVHLPKSAMAGSCSRSIPGFLGICHTDLHSEYERFHSHQHCTLLFLYLHTRPCFLTGMEPRAVPGSLETHTRAQDRVVWDASVRMAPPQVQHHQTKKHVQKQTCCTWKRVFL